jgi:hypothetical protein
MCPVFASLVARKYQQPSMRGIKDRALTECTGSSFLATLFLYLSLLATLSQSAAILHKEPQNKVICR